MTNPWPAASPDPNQQPQQWQTPQPDAQWSQPPFAPGFAEPQPQPGYTSPLPPSAPGAWSAGYPPQQNAGLPAAVTGSVFIPGAIPPKAGRLESLLRVLAGVLWPVFIFSMIFGHGRFWPGVFVVIVISAVLRHFTRDLKRRRIEGASIVPPPPGPPYQDLR